MATDTAVMAADRNEESMTVSAQQSDQHGGRPLVGILGGMGPAATADFYRKLIERTPATRDQDHLRVVIWADPTVPGRARGGRGADPYPALLEGAQNLRTLGASMVAMPCNSAHAYLDRLVQDTGLHFVDMVRETTRWVADLDPPENDAVGVLGARQLIRSGLYQQGLAEHGIETVVADGEEQAALDLAIRYVKGGYFGAASRLATDVANAFVDRGLTRILLACTELPIAMSATLATGDPRFVDPTDVLARAVVRQCCPARQ
ncbi:aspartate racemase [Flexivirga endophytica]|uniref:Aspartate racemase n=1 Tax=Flexivirga endophytica TaxID=1849103 RepID=A0A916T2J4_9MICO|nr:amino acid racemase [Flexivirga endophytica]GGB26061.1 aspartate racemase [Flexivirga endophytica]GHB54609.1 aspartate racemase [Flexivirga endophytica]